MPSSRLAFAVEALRRPGGVICYPTETVYGLGGRACDAASAERIGRLKGRGLQPLIVLVAGVPEGLPAAAAPLIEAFWPGPMTLIVPALPGIAPSVLGPDGTVAVRWSSHPVVQELVEAVGPITSTSANRTGEPPLLIGTCPLDVDLTLDFGPLEPEPPSTLVDLASGRLLREGRLAPAIRRMLG